MRLRWSCVNDATFRRKRGSLMWEVKPGLLLTSFNACLRCFSKSYSKSFLCFLMLFRSHFCVYQFFIYFIVTPHNIYINPSTATGSSQKTWGKHQQRSLSEKRSTLTFHQFFMFGRSVSPSVPWRLGKIHKTEEFIVEVAAHALFGFTGLQNDIMKRLKSEDEWLQRQ